MVIQKPFISAKQVNPAIDLRESTIAHGWRSLLKLLVFNTPMISGKAVLLLPLRHKLVHSRGNLAKNSAHLPYIPTCIHKPQRRCGDVST